MPTSCAEFEPEGDVDEEDPPILHLVVSAATAPRLITRPIAVRTVFELARLDELGCRLWRQPSAQRTPHRIERDVDRVRSVQIVAQETPEWLERERKRRAKQRPPRPPKVARTRGKKLRDLIGDAYLDD